MEPRRENDNTCHLERGARRASVLPLFLPAVRIPLQLRRVRSVTGCLHATCLLANHACYILVPQTGLLLLILASSSPRRRELLTRAGIPFEAQSADVNEEHRPG